MALKTALRESLFEGFGRGVALQLAGRLIAVKLVYLSDFGSEQLLVKELEVVEQQLFFGCGNEMLIY